MSEKTSKEKVGKGAKMAQAAWRVGDKAVSLTKKISLKSAGQLVGKGTFKIVKPFVSLYDGFKDGFKSGQ